MNRTLACASGTDTRSGSGRSQYGWVMVGVGALAMVSTLPGRTYGLGMITERILADPTFNLDEIRWGFLNLCATLIGATFCIGIGKLIDRFGLRFSIACVMFPFALSVILMSKVTSIALLVVALTLVRGFGQSSLSVVSITSVGKWFPARPSLPMAVYSVLLTMGFIAATLVAKEFGDINWRQLWSAIGACVLIAGILATVLSRDPNRFDPAPVEGSNVSADPTTSIEEVDSFRWSEAVRTPFFAAASLSIALFSFTLAGMTLFNESILADRGFDQSVYYDSLAIGTGVGLIANLIAGGLGIRFSVNRLLAMALLLVFLSMVQLLRLNSWYDVVVYVTLNASGGGMLTVLFFMIWPKLYGKAHLGSIQGTAQMLTVIASATGPLAFAFCKKSTDSYQMIIAGLAGLLLVMAVACWLCPLPQRNRGT